jgi:hypothetical protein
MLVTLFLCLLFCSQVVIFTYASGGSKATTFNLGDFGPSLCYLEVRFSWDSDSWKIGENHKITFSFQAKNINPNVVELDLNVKKIVIQLESDVYDIYPSDLLSQDVSNQMTRLVWRQDSTTILNVARSFSFDVNAPKPLNPLTEDANVKLIYLVQFSGNSRYEEVGGANLHGDGRIEDYVSNDGNRIGGLEAPVWITVNAEPPSFPWLYVAVTLVGAGIIGASAFLIVRRRRLKKV